MRMDGSDVRVSRLRLAYCLTTFSSHRVEQSRRLLAEKPPTRFLNNISSLSSFTVFDSSLFLRRLRTVHGFFLVLLSLLLLHFLIQLDFLFCIHRLNAF